MQTRPGLGGGQLTGDVTQVHATAAALQDLGVDVRFSDALEADADGVDVAHLFSTLNPHYTYLRLRHLQERGIPVAVSTIYWEWEPAEQRLESELRLGPLGAALSRAVNAVRKRLPAPLRYRAESSAYDYGLQRRFYALEGALGLAAMRRYIYEKAEVLLPNSHLEYDFLRDRFGIENDYVAVPNAVDASFAGGDAEAFRRRHGLRDFAMCCAVIQARKNQRRLIQAADALGIPLVLVGSAEPRYAMRCREAAGSGTYFLGEMKGDALRDAYAAARTHALVSFYETPGLASLEAAVSDNSIVVSERGSTREYFQDQAFYCDPSNLDSIKEALSRGFAAAPDPALKARVLSDYTWRRTAEETLLGYERAIAKRRCAGDR